MYGKVKMSKRQIKEDKFTAFMLTAKNQVTDNWQFFAVGIVIVILLIVAVGYFMDSREAKANQAAEMYSQAVLSYQQGNTQFAVVNLNQLIEEYSGQPAAEKATYFLGTANLNSNNYPEADRYFQMYIDNYRSDLLTLAAAHAGLGISAENQGLFDKAIEHFKSAIAVDPDGALSPDYHLGILRNALEVGNIDLAAEYKDKISQSYGNTPIENTALVLFAEKSAQ